MEEAIERVLKKYHMSDCKLVNSPNLPAGKLKDDETPDPKFPIRELVGSLQYTATICRADIAHPVQKVAREVTKCTNRTVKASKRIEIP